MVKQNRNNEIEVSKKCICFLINLALHSEQSPVHIVHEVERAAVRFDHLRSSLGNREDQWIHAHLALHGANNVQQRAELVFNNKSVYYYLQQTVSILYIGKNDI